MNSPDFPSVNGTVLFVDPFATICEVVAFILRTSGYAVITATSFAEALRIVSSGESLDLLLMDDELPASEGQDLAEVFLEWHPDGAVLELGKPRRAAALFAGKTLIDSVTDALLARIASRCREGALA